MMTRQQTNRQALLSDLTADIKFGEMQGHDMSVLRRTAQGLRNEIAAESRDLSDMTESEINRIIFEGAGCSEPRGLRDRLTDEEIIALPNHPAWTEWTTAWQDWIWNAIDSITKEDE